MAAANDWKVPVSEVSVANGVITHTASKRTTTYGKVAAAALRLWPVLRRVLWPRREPE